MTSIASSISVIFVTSFAKSIMITKARDLVERSAFGVCQQISDWIGIKASKVRLYFIYASFLTVGSPVILYLVMAFWLNLKRYLSSPGKLNWD